MRQLTPDVFVRSRDCARQFCSPEMLSYLDPELRDTPAKSFYDGRIVKISANGGKVAVMDPRALLLVIEGPFCDRLLTLRFVAAKDLSIGKLDLMSLPDLLMLEFSEAVAGYHCTIHFLTTDADIKFTFESVEFSVDLLKTDA